MAYTVCHAPVESYVRRRHIFVTIATREPPTVVFSTLAEWHPDEVTLKSICRHSC